MEVETRPITAEEVDEAFRLEQAGYPAEEGASRASLEYRQKEAPDLFLGMFEGKTMIAGKALQLLSRYHDHVKKTQQKAIKMNLLVKAHVIPLYTRAGFTLLGKTDIVHGKDPWHEMEKFI